MPKQTAITEVTPEESEKLLRDAPFNPFRAAVKAPATALVNEVLASLDADEAARGLRQRKRRPADQSTYERAVGAVVADLIYRVDTEPDGWVAVSLSKRRSRKSRYRSSVLGNTFSKLLTRMVDLGWIEMNKGIINPFNAYNFATTIRATERLFSRAGVLEVESSDFGIDESDETIVLKVPKDSVNVWEDKRLDYPDSDLTRRYRNEMLLINTGIGAADLSYVGPVPASGEINLSDRRLKRFFNGGWEKGGRLFGGFWLNIEKKYRKGLRIDGATAVTLDYSQMAPRTVYAMAGQKFRGDDAYAIEGFQYHRNGIKKLFSSMLCASKPLVRFPQGVSAQLPRHLDFKSASDAILQAHEPIRDRFYQGVGLEAMFRESQIIVEVLLKLMEHGITALPIHDAVMVAEQHQGVAQDTMASVYRKHLGVAPVIKVEGDN